MHHIEEREVSCFIATISDTRTVETDKSGKLIKELLQEKGHSCAGHIIIPDDQEKIAEAIMAGLANEEVEAVLLTGGTGISLRDVTIEVVDQIVDKEIPGFGELFRMLSYTEDIGSRAIMSRATAGVKGRKVVFAMPGSSGAVKLAMNKLILPELAHILQELYKDL